jgi:hypothetical protein
MLAANVQEASKEFRDFVTAIGECKSKQEEDRIVAKEMCVAAASPPPRSRIRVAFLSRLAKPFPGLPRAGRNRLRFDVWIISA